MSLSFKPELMVKVLAGEKTVTRRELPVNYEAGQEVAIVPGMGRISCGRVRILDVTEAGLLLDDDEAKREGFATPEAFLTYWHLINPGSYNYEKFTVARIEFVLIEITRTICKCCGGIGTKAVPDA